MYVYMGKKGRATAISPPDSAGFHPGRGMPGRGIWDEPYAASVYIYIYNV